MKSVNIDQVLFRENETFLKSFTDGPRMDKGQLFFLIDLPDNPGAEDSLVEKLWRTLHDTFFNCQSDDQYYCFEEALKSINELLEQENKKRESGTIGRMHAIVALLDGNTLHFSSTGHAALALKRAKHFSIISEESDSDADGGFMTISSGALANDDVLAFFTRLMPFDEAILLDVFSQKGAKISQHLKALSKQKELTGLVFYWTYVGEQDDNVSVAPSPTEKNGEKSYNEPVAEKNENKGRKSIRAISSIAKKIKIRNSDKAKEAFKGVVGGMSSKLSKLIKKPKNIKHVNRRYVLLSVIGLLVLFGVLMTLQSNYREQAQQSEYYENLLSQAKMNVTYAEQRFLIGEKTDSTDFLNKADASLKEIMTAGFFPSEVSKLQNELELHRDNFDAIFRVAEPIVFADLSQKGTVDAIGIINTQDQRNFVYEPRRLFETLLDKVQEPLQIDSEEIIISGAELSDFNVLSFITQSGQVLEYEIRNGRFETATTQDDTWNKGVDIQTFNGEFLYVLDPSSSTIWKYRRLRNGYSTATAYNSEGDLSNAISLAIDGDIFVLNRDASIIRFRKGKILPYSLTSQPSIPPKNPTAIFTIPEANNIYILDSPNSRVVVYSKNTSGSAEYEKQIIFESLKANEIRDLYVDKDEQKLTILTADKVYITDL